MYDIEAKPVVAAAPREEAGYRSLSTTRRINLVIKTAIAILISLFALYPIPWILSAALNPSNTLVNQQIIPKGATLDNFQKLFNDPQHPWLHWILNSVLVSGTTAIITVGLTAL